MNTNESEFSSSQAAIINQSPPEGRKSKYYLNIMSKLMKSCACLRFGFYLFLVLSIYITNGTQAQQLAAGLSQSAEPALILIVPQSFKVPTNPFRDEGTERLQQHVAIVNNAQDDFEDQQIRENYKKLSLQIRDEHAGQLFFESVFEYFPRNTRNHLLIPVNLEHVTANGHRARKLIVSVRAHSETKLGGGEELVRSTPILLEWVPSADGQRTFSIVQTDKPVYKPSETVKIRALLINENLRPIVGDDVRIQIRNPHKLLVEELRFPRPNKNGSVYLDHEFEFPPEPMLGTWTVHLLHSDPIANDTTSFEVREYELPPFEVSLESPEYILPSTTLISGAAVAKYHYGKPVRGTVKFKFGYKQLHLKTKYIAQSTIKDIDLKTGRAEYQISSSKFNQSWFPQIDGSQFVVEATVTETTTGHHEIVQDTSCLFIKTPYRISFDESIDDFKPGLSQQLKVQIVETLSGRPGPAGIRIVAEYCDQNNTRIDAPSMVAENKLVDFRNRLDTEAVSNERGEAVFNIGPLTDDLSTIYVSMHAPNLSESGQLEATKTKRSIASGQFALYKHESQNGWISLMNKSLTHLNVGDNFISKILIRDEGDAVVIRQKIFYVITNKGHIVTMNNLDPNGLVNFVITERMMPSIRLVVFALTHDSIGLRSDSMRISIERDLNCGLNISYKSKKAPQISTNEARPNEVGTIEVSARQGDVVSLIGVDNAVYSLNNRTRLESSRIIERIKRLDPGCGFGGGQNNLDVFYNAGLMLFNGAVGYWAQNKPIGTSCRSFARHLEYVEESLMGYSKPMFRQQAGKARLLTGWHRQKRDTETELELESLIESYSDKLQKACCRLGTFDDEPQRRTCEVRRRIVQKYMRDSGKCSAAYYECCKKTSDQATELKVSALVDALSNKGELEISARSEKPLGFSAAHPITESQLEQMELQTLVRRDFRESWLFEVIPVDEASGQVALQVQLPHSITSWSISALALNRDRPVCLMARPLLLTGFQEVFVRVSMPYKVVQHEQIDLVVTLFNYSPTTQHMLVYMYGVEDICSEAEPGERSQLRRVSVEGHASQALIFSLIPLKVGSFPIKIVALTESSNSSDMVEHELMVVPRGRPVTDETTFSLDPMNQQRRTKRAIQTGNLVDEIDSKCGLQRSRVRLTPSRESEYIVPQTQECIVSAIGDRMGQSVQTTLLDVDNLIRLPHGCGEQVMIYMAPTLYTARYLNSTHRLTGDLRWRANRYIQSGYKRVLNFRNADGSFSAFAGRRPSVWLTAFIGKILCQAERTPFVANEVNVDKMLVRSALSWLIDQQNKESGTWIDPDPVYHREMLGGVLKENGLTAFVAITLSECSHHAAEVADEIPMERREGQRAREHPAHVSETEGISKLSVALEKAKQALVLDRHRALRERNPYVLALLAYSLSLVRSDEAVDTFGDLISLSDRSRDTNHLFWGGDHPIEAAAYALQALIELAPLIVEPPEQEARESPQRLKRMPGADALAIANWLSSQRSYTGAFESTQDTVVALEALSKFSELQATANGSGLLQQTRDLVPNLHCNLSINNRMSRSIKFGDANSQVLQTLRLDPLDLDTLQGDTLDVTTSGNGLGVMTVKLKYNVFEEDDGLCRFNIDSKIEEYEPKPTKFNRSPFGAGKDPKTAPDEKRPNPSSDEEDYFVDAMLVELNVLAVTNPVQNVSRDNKPRQERNLRVKRLSPPLMGASRDAADWRDGDESWTSRMVSSIRSKLPVWVSPRTKSTTERPQAPYMEPIKHEAPPAARRNSTQRRSTQLSPEVPPTASNPESPDDLPMNALSERIEISSQNRSSGEKVTQQIIHDPTKHLVLRLSVCTEHQSNLRDSEMAVIEVGILSGFKPNEADLTKIKETPNTPVMKYEFSSDRSMLMFYLDHIPHSGSFCFQLRLVRDSPVYNLQSGYVRVYEYYSPTRSCSSFYKPARINNLMKLKCDAAREVCQCANKILCPATSKLLSLSATHATNSTSARNKLVELVCQTKYDLVSLVKLKSVHLLEAARTMKLQVKVMTDIRGNLTKIVEAQRQQKKQLVGKVRKPVHSLDSSLADSADIPDNSNSSDLLDESSLDYLQLTMDPNCFRDDMLLLHLSDSSQQKHEGNKMILFARSNRLERRYFRATKKTGAHANSAVSVPTFGQGPRPKPNILGLRDNGTALQEDRSSLADFKDAETIQYSLALSLDRDSILHDLSYREKLVHREAINKLIEWLDMRLRREKWTCGKQ